MASPLKDEFEWYLAHQHELVQQYNGKFVVIKDGQVLGVYDDQFTAVVETEKTHQLGTFLVQKVEPGKAGYTQTFHSRVVFPWGLFDPNSKSFTVTAHGGLLRSLQTTCHISKAFTPSPGGPAPTIESFTSIWDTGASASLITQNVVDACGLAPIGMTKVHTASGEMDAETYLVNIWLPNAVAFMHVQVTKGILGAGADVLIGMDIISQGDFTVTNKGGITVFSFRYPSAVHIDFVREHQEGALRARIAASGKGGFRNKKRKT